MKLILLTLAISAAYAHIPPPCAKPVYCSSKLLHYVQMAQIFPDSKKFVDLQLKHNEHTVLSEFELLFNHTGYEMPKETLQQFVNAHFALADEFEQWHPSDYQQHPSFVDSIKDHKLKQFGQDVNAIWPSLGRKIKQAVFEKPEFFSVVPVHHGFIVPDGQAKEFYYWDSYWIIEGLLVSGMKDTVKGVISNLVELQRQFGHIPYGNRYYYQDRSQPPLLSAMMFLYVRSTNDVEFLKANIDAVEAELEYWLDTHTVVFHVNKREHTLLRYFSQSQGPRPESYYQDYVQAQVFDSEEAQEHFYNNVKSGDESGWAFSSRWFVGKDGSNKGNFTDIHTSSIIPVDLNAIFTNAMDNVVYFHSVLHNSRRGAHWAHLAKQWKNSIKEVFWNEEDGIWYDFDLEHSHQRKYFYLSNVAPLWMQVVDKEFIHGKAGKIMNYLKKTQVFQFPGGVPASVIRSGEEWDFPYSYPPLVSIMVSALEALHTEESSKYALQVAQSFIRSAYKGFISGKQLFEKYDVESPGKFGTGSYAVQPGYGWSTGVVLEILAKYGQALSYEHSYYGYDQHKPQAVLFGQAAQQQIFPNPQGTVSLF